jgi:hypothetical protein
MKILFYKYNGARNKVNKILGAPVTLTGKISEMDYITPVVCVRGNVDGCTMCYIEAIKRYYFIDSINYDGDKSYLSLSCDSLMTFKEQILEATGEIYATDEPHKYDGDYKPICDVRTQKEKITFPLNELTEDGSIIMITIKGNR